MRCNSSSSAGLDALTPFLSYAPCIDRCVFGLGAGDTGKEHMATGEDEEEDALILVNPAVKKVHGTTKELGLEGCLSVPGYEGNVERNTDIEVEYLTRTGSLNIQYRPVYARAWAGAWAGACVKCPLAPFCVISFVSTCVGCYVYTGDKVERRLTGFGARLFQHERDHLDGILYIDLITDPDRNFWEAAEDSEGSISI